MKRTPEIERVLVLFDERSDIARAEQVKACGALVGDWRAAWPPQKWVDRLMVAWWDGYKTGAQLIEREFPAESEGEDAPQG